MTPQEEEEGGHERRGADFRHRHREQLYHREQRRHGQEGGDQPDQRPPRTRRRVCTCRRHGASGIATAPAQQQQGRDRPVWLQDRGRPGATTSARVPRAASLPRRLCHVDAHHRQHGWQQPSITTTTASHSASSTGPRRRWAAARGALALPRERRATKREAKRRRKRERKRKLQQANTGGLPASININIIILVAIYNFDIDINNAGIYV